MAAYIPMAIQAAATVGSGYLAGKGAQKKETKLQKTKRHLIDQLLASINSGEGPYADLFAADEEAFNRSFVQPAQAMFRNQIAPNIQQSYIASGQQRGTGLDDQLLRAGVDLDSMLNQQYYQFQQDALNRKKGLLDSVLRSGDGAETPPTDTQHLQNAGAGYLGSDDFKELTKKFSSDFFPAPGQDASRKGFEAS